jgi:hypothetical protein
MTAPYQLVLVYRHGCHLCEEMAAHLYRHYPRQFAGLIWRNVDEDEELRQRFDARVPVLLAGNQVVCELGWDPQRAAACFGPPVNPV